MTANSDEPDKLGRYRALRDAGRTPEPFGSGVAPRLEGAGVFVVQQHAARRMHYDFRLELGGVLVSWAVPRGPSLDPSEKRLAVHVEDHPLDYADFEGVIPAGNYGAGPVIVWDRGMWRPVEDPVAGLAAGKLLFDLRGYKLGGRWTLVRSGRGKKGEGGADEWLLIKKPDGFADASRALPEVSIYSGLRVDELEREGSRGSELAALAADAGAPERPVDPRRLRLSLCETAEAPFSDPDWIFELKYDGYRMIAAVEDGAPFLRYRRGSDATALYPEVTRALARLPLRSCVLDGEVVVLDAGGRSDFGLLQRRATLARPQDIARAAAELPATLVVFDLLALEGRDLRDLPLETRKELLARLLPPAGPVKYCDHVEERGEAFFEQIGAFDLEGMVAKDRTRPYRGRRTGEWLRVRRERADDFAVVGYSAPRSAGRTGFAGLHLAARDGEDWVYAGKVGTGFDERELASIRAALDELPRRDYGWDDRVAGKGHVWVEPRLVATVVYKEWREGRLLRQPRFLHLRSDKAPEECARPAPGQADAPPEPAVAAAAAADAPPALAFTNLEKTFWPDEGYTKGDLVAYYRSIAPWLLPYLRDRPVVLTRYPDGIDGKSFYQKDAPTWAPDWLRTAEVWSEHAGRAIHYFVCDDLESLLYLVNLGTIPLHVWPSRASSLGTPDWCILDLDPKGAPWRDVVTCARAIRALCDDIGLPTYVKTSGSTGLHVLIPLGRQCTYEQSRDLAGILVRLIESEHGDIATTNRTIEARGGKVYLDWLQNRHGQLLVAPLSVRPLPGAPVSMPLRWREVTPRLDHRRFTIANAARRMARLGDDPLRPVLSDAPDLIAALDALRRRVEG